MQIPVLTISPGGGGTASGEIYQDRWAKPRTIFMGGSVPHRLTLPPSQMGLLGCVSRNPGPG